MKIYHNIRSGRRVGALYSFRTYLGPILYRCCVGGGVTKMNMTWYLVLWGQAGTPAEDVTLFHRPSLDSPKSFFVDLR